MTTTSQPEGKKQALIIIKWVAGIFLFLLGLVGFSQSFLAGTFFILSGAAIIPIVSEWLKTKFPIWEKKYVRIIVPILLFFIGMILVGSEGNSQSNVNTTNTERKKDVTSEVVKKEETVIPEKEIAVPEDTRPLISYTIEKEATIRYDNAPSYYVLIDKVDLQDATLTDKIKRLIDEIVEEKGAMLNIEIFDHKETLEKTYIDDMPSKGSFDASAMKTLMKLQEIHYIATFTGELKDMPTSNTLAMFPATSSKTIKYIPTTRNSSTAQQQTEKTKNAHAASEKKKEKFKKDCFSVWDGSCTELVYYVKENMNNPKSFEHVTTQYSIAENYAIVGMTYRGTNAYGAVVTESIRAKMSFDCKVLEIMK